MLRELNQAVYEKREMKERRLKAIEQQRSAQ
jgi:hypothetical protein